MQTLIVIVIVAIAAIYLGRRFYRSIKTPQANTCSCGCNGCTEVDSCEQPEVSIIDHFDSK